jgi:hypothetical protein
MGVEYFKSMVRNMVQLVLEHDSLLPMASRDDITFKANSLKGQEVKTMQLCAWSPTPRFDRDCLALAMNMVVPLCEGSLHIMVEDPAKIFKPDTLLGKAFSKLSDVDGVKSSLLWLLGEDMAGKFMAKAMALRNIWEPLQEKHDDDAAEAYRLAVGQLERLLVKETAEQNLGSLKELLNQKKIPEIRKYRQEAKTQRTQVPPALLQRMEDLAVLDHTVDLAKYQTFKWGLAMFMYHKDSRATNESGKDLRQNLKALWDKHSTDAGFVAYFGKQATEEVKEILAIKAETAAAAKAGKAGKALAAEARAREAATPPAKKCRKAP